MTNLKTGEKSWKRKIKWNSRESLRRIVSLLTSCTIVAAANSFRKAVVTCTWLKWEKNGLFYQKTDWMTDDSKLSAKWMLGWQFSSDFLTFKTLNLAWFSSGARIVQSVKFKLLKMLAVTVRVVIFFVLVSQLNARLRLRGIECFSTNQTVSSNYSCTYKKYSSQLGSFSSSFFAVRKVSFVTVRQMSFIYSFAH